MSKGPTFLSALSALSALDAGQRLQILSAAVNGDSDSGLASLADVVTAALGELPQPIADGIATVQAGIAALAAAAPSGEGTNAPGSSGS